MPTLISVQKQNFDNFECLIVDDHSTDNTALIVESIISKDLRFRYLKNKQKKGAPGARNTGINQSCAQYVIFLDSDDILLEHALTNRLQAINDDPELELVIANMARRKNGTIDYLINIPTQISPIIRFYSLYPSNDIPWLNNIMVKRDFLINNNIYWDENLERFQDIQFNLSLLLAKPKFKWLNTKVDSYWVHDKHASIGKNLEMFPTKLAAITQFYIDKLQLVTIQYSNYHQLFIKKVKALCCYTLFNLPNPKDAATYYAFIKEQNLFNFLDLKLLEIYHQQSNTFLKRLIRLNFRLKLYKALDSNLFLKIPYAE